MREKRGREEKAAAGRWSNTQDLPEMRRGILHPEPKCGTVAEKSLLALPDQCRTSLEQLGALADREGNGWGESSRKVSQTKRRVRSCAIWSGQRDLISLCSRTHTNDKMASVTWTAASHESLIGPSSELIHINDFLRSSGDSAAGVLPTAAGIPEEQSSEGIDPALNDSIASECRWVSRPN